MTDFDDTLKKCVIEIDKGFQVGEFSLVLKAGQHNRTEMIKQLQIKYPQYDVTEYQMTKIWVSGDEKVYEEAFVFQVQNGTCVLEYFPERFTTGLLTSMKKRFPYKQFDVMKDIETNRNVIIVNKCQDTAMGKLGELYKYYKDI